MLTPSNGSKHKFIVMESDFIEHPAFKKLTLTAKVLYSFLMYRLNVSAENPEKYRDEQGHFFVISTQKKFAEKLGVHVTTVERATKELREANLIQTRQAIVGKPYRIYLFDWQEVANMQVAPAPQNAGPTAPQNAGPTAPQNAGQYNINKDKQDINKSTSDKSKALSLSTSAATRVLPSEKPLIPKPPKPTKAQRNKEKWFLERKTQINGRGFTPEVVTALQRFLTTLKESGKSADQITATAWDMQLEELEKLNDYPDLQKDAVYKSCGYRNMLISIENVREHNRIGKHKGGWHNLTNPDDKNSGRQPDPEDDGEVEYF